MRLGEIMLSAVRGLTVNKVRSALTTLSILIGVGAVIMLVAVGNGAAKEVEDAIAGLGTNTLTVHPQPPGFGRQQSTQPGRDLTIDDARALADQQLAPHIKSVAPITSASGTLAYGNRSKQVNELVGTSPAFFEATNSKVATGEYFTNADVTEARKVLVLGKKLAEALFDFGIDPIGKKVQINSIQFTVVGVLAGKEAAGGDEIAIAPLTTVQQTLSGFGGLQRVLVQAKSAADLAAAKSEIGIVLGARHRIEATGTPDFQVLDERQLLQAQTKSNNTFTMLLASVAAISLLVGGVGVTNIMLVTVTERTREIGIRKAVGATRAAVLGQFLAESTLLSLFGGVLGVVAALVGSQFTIAGIKPVVVPSSVLLAFGVSAFIGLFFGSYPANRAARLRPIEALRHE